MIINSLVVKKGSAPDPGPGEGDYLVRFIDYDGTILKQQRVNSGNAATAPTVPTHIGLTFQEWNNAFSAVTGDIDVGATYITSDGKTHAKVRLTVPSGLSLTLYLNKSNTDEMTVDWGDGSAVSTFTNSGNFNTGAHTFPDYGDYDVTIWMSSGTGTYGFGNASSTTTFVGGNTQEQRSTLLELYIGTRVAGIGASAFFRCSSLASLTIHALMTGSIGVSAFESCHSLVSLTLPAGMTGSIGVIAFRYNYNLASLLMPAGMGGIGSGACQYCYGLISLTLPAGMTGSIGSAAFQYCPCMLEYIFSLTTPSTLSGADAFDNINSACRIFVPDASVLAYRAATNWVTYANYIQPISNRSGSAVILFQDNGADAAVAPLVGTKGATATEPTAPTKADVTFDGWYKEAALTNAWNWATDVYPSTNLTLFAKWV
jgi:uncharacterized repeat protein (TIGR02543 family)